MKESVLQHIWQHQNFDFNDLKTTENLSLKIFDPGQPNANEGPDFLNAKISIDGIEWHGHIEIHTVSSNWLLHKHDDNKKYQNVILHVVLTNDLEVSYLSSEKIPTLELKKYLDPSILENYIKNTPDRQIPCRDHVSKVPDSIKYKAIEQAAFQRLERKLKSVYTVLKESKNDWEQTTFETIGSCYGLKINKEPFTKLCKTVPFKLLQKQQNLLQRQAILLGQSGLIDKIEDKVFGEQLKNEYHFLQKKFDLNSPMRQQEWNYHRLRPASFPHKRILQLARLTHDHNHLFDKLIEYTETKQFVKIFDMEEEPNFTSIVEVQSVSSNLAHLIMINAFIPVILLYAKLKKSIRHQNVAINLLNELPPEDNNITRQYRQYGMKADSAYYSQGILELHNEWCTKKQCLNCPVGFDFLVSKN